MDNFWKGTFAPFRKHISEVRYVTLVDMSGELWEVLDYPRLAPVPKRRIQSHIMNCSLLGFYIVDVDQHLGKVHGGKPRYIWPTADGEGREFDEEKALAEFGNFEGYDEDIDTIEAFEKEYRRVQKNPRSQMWPLIAAIAYKAYKAYQRQQQQEEPPPEEETEQEEYVQQREATTDEERIEEYLEERFGVWPRWALTLLYMAFEKCGVPKEFMEEALDNPDEYGV